MTRNEGNATSTDSSSPEEVGEEKRELEAVSQTNSPTTSKGKRTIRKKRRKNHGSGSGTMTNRREEESNKKEKSNKVTSTPITSVGVKVDTKKKGSKQVKKDSLDTVRRRLDGGHTVEVSLSSVEECMFDSTGSSLREAANDGALSVIVAAETEDLEPVPQVDDERDSAAKYKGLVGLDDE